jgi:gliding motility-associated-like protein
MTRNFLFTLSALVVLFVSGTFSITASAQGWTWGRGATGAGGETWPMAADNAGNVYGGGYKLGSATIAFGGGVTAPAGPANQVFWVKYNNAGVPLWAGGNTSGNGYIFNMTCDVSGNLIVYGAFTSASITFGSVTLTKATTSPGQYYILKVSPTGTVLWGVTDGNVLSSYLSLYGSFIMSTGAVDTDPAGNIYISGSYRVASMTIGSTTLTNSNSAGTTYDIFVAKYTPAGAPVWATSVGGPGNDYGWGVTRSSTGDVYASGAFWSPSMTIGSSTVTNPVGSATATGGFSSAYIAKFSPTGTPLWAEAGMMPSPTNKHSFAVGLAKDNYGNVYMTGGFSDTSIKFGATTITQPYNPPATGRNCLFLVQYSPANAVTWFKRIGSPGSGTLRPVFGFCIALASCGQVWVSGNFKDSANIDGAILTAPVGSASDPVFIAGYDLAGGVVGYGALGSGSDDQNGIACDNAGNVFICADYLSTPLTVGPDVLPIGTGGSEFFYVGKYANAAVLPDTTYNSHDTFACGTSTLTLTAPSGYSSYYWDDSSTSSTRVVGTGTYFVYSSTCGDTTHVDTFHVYSAINDTTFTHKDTSACAGIGTATLTGPSGYTTYSWSTGASGASLTVSSAGTYILYARIDCSVLVDTFHFSITPNDTTFMLTDVGACVLSPSTTLTGPAGHTTYNWSTGASGATLAVSTAGDYILYATTACSVLVDTFRFVLNGNDSTFFRHDTDRCASVGAITLSGVTGYSSYSWSTGATTSSISAGTSGTYIRYAVDLTGCTVRVDSYYVIIHPNPTVNLGNDTGFCIGNTLVLSSPQPAGTTYLWSTGSTASTIGVSTSGAYSLTVTDIYGCTGSDIRNVMVSPVPVVNLGPDTTNCGGNPVTLQSLVTYPATASYQWSTGSTTPTTVATVTATYWLTVTINGCPGSDTINVRILFDTVTLKNGDTAICRGQTVYVNAWGGPGNTFQWVPTAGVSNPTVANATITPDTSAMYVLLGYLPGCHVLRDSFFIEVQPNPTVYLGNRTVCRHDSLHIAPMVSPQWFTGYMYQWSPATAVDNPAASAVVYTADTTVKIKVSVTTSAGCSTADSAMITVHPADTISEIQPIALCPRGSKQIIPTTTGPGSTYKWSPSMYIRSDTSAAPWIFPITSLTYTVISTNKYGCSDTETVNVTVHPGATIFVGDSVTIYPGESYQISPQTNCVSFVWSPSAGLNNTHISNPVAKPDANTRYIVSAANEWGCLVTDTLNIYVSTESLLTLPNAFTPGSSNKLFKVLKRGEATLNYFRIFNRWGELVYETTNIDEGWDGTYKGQVQPFGVYVYDIEAVTSTGKLFHKNGNVTLIK